MKERMMQKFEMMVAVLIFSVLAACLGIVTQATAASSATDESSNVVEKVLFDFADEHAAEMWHLNIWDENEQGERGSGVVEVVEADAPFGDRALRLSTHDAGRFTFSGPIAGIPDGPWRKNKYHALELWYRGNGTQRKWRLQILTSHPDPEIKHAKYDGVTLFLGNTQWQRLIITNMNNRAGHDLPFDWSRIQRIQINGDGTEQLEIGRITLLGGDRKIPLASTDQPAIYVPAFDRPPVIDGQLNEPIWQHASIIKQLQKYVRDAGLTEPSAFPTNVRLGYVPPTLYVGVQLQGESTDLLESSRRDMNERLWNDPSLELFLDPNKSNHDSHQYVVNAVNTTWEHRALNASQKLRWDSATTLSSSNQSWSLEAGIDLESLVGGPVQTGDVWGINFARNAQKEKDGQIMHERSGWSQGRATPVEGFGWLVFGSKPTAQTLKLQDVELYALEDNNLGLRLLAHNMQDQPRTFELQATLTPPLPGIEAQTFRHSFTVEGDGSQYVTMTLDDQIEAEGKHRLQLVFRDPQRTVHWLDTFDVSRSKPIIVKPMDVVLRPVPRVWQTADGAWLLPARLRIGVQGDGDRFPAKHLAQSLSERYGVDVELADSGGADIVLHYAVDVAKHDDGFVLDVTTDGVVLQAQASTGMYYGIRAVLDIVRQSSLGEVPAQAKAVHCEDWPEKDHRVVFMRIDSRYRISPGVDAMKDFIYDQVAGGRQNLLIINPRHAFEYKSHPEITRDISALTQGEMREIVDFARRHYVDVAPGGNSPGHASWIIQKRPDLAYQGDINLLDMVDPEKVKESRKLLTDLYSELIGVFKPRYFHLGGDEVRWPPTDDPNELNARRQQLLDHWLFMFDFLRSKGVTPIIWDDMLSSSWNGGAPHYTAQILPKLPRDIVIAQWSDRPGMANSPTIYRELGFNSLWRVMTSFFTDRADRAVHWQREWDGIGVGLFAHWPWSNFNHVPYQKLIKYTIGVHLSSTLAWNPQSIANAGGADRFLSMYGQHWTQTMRVPTWGTRQISYQPIALDHVVNHSTQRNWMDAGEQSHLVELPADRITVSGIPFARTATRDDAIRVEQAQRAAPIAVGQQVRGLAFLHAAGVADQDAMNALRQTMFRKNTAPYAMDIAYYVVQYEDGETARVPVKLGWNIHFWNCEPAARIMPAVSGYWTGFTAAQRQRDPNRPDAALWAIEWKNQRPDVAVESVTLEGGGTEATVALLALTAVR